MKTLLESVEDGTLGPLNANRLYAMGISSGGFMTSRMAVSYPGKFRALAVHSGSYATCSSVCVLPDLPADHPPTLFLHGGQDFVVPLSVMEVYRDALMDLAVPVQTTVDPDAGHAWLEQGITDIPAWFRAHP